MYYRIILSFIGVAFSSTYLTRCGYGMGYYDTFLERVKERREELGKENAMKVGLCFEEQLVESLSETEGEEGTEGVSYILPVDEYDIQMTHVVTSGV